MLCTDGNYPGGMEKLIQKREDERNQRIPPQSRHQITRRGRKKGTSELQNGEKTTNKRATVSLYM